MFLFQEITEVVFAVGIFINALLFVPQAIKVFKEKYAKEVSLITFAGFNVMQLASFFHAFWRSDYTFAIGSLASFFTCGAVTTLVVIYRCKNRKKAL